MTESQKTEIRKHHTCGMSYKAIAQITGISVGTVKAFCSRERIAPAKIQYDVHRCLCCGIPVEQNEGRKEKKFCSDSCRMKWWNSHLDQVNRKTFYEFKCARCGRKFTAYGNAHRKYCSRECFSNARCGGDNFGNAEK